MPMGLVRADLLIAFGYFTSCGGVPRDLLRMKSGVVLRTLVETLKGSYAGLRARPSAATKSLGIGDVSEMNGEQQAGSNGVDIDKLTVVSKFWNSQRGAALLATFSK